MLQVYHFGRAEKLPDASPFCLKLLTYMRMADIEYETVRGSQNLNKSPKGKMPFIIHDGNTLGDSSLIIDYLKETFGDTLDGKLSDEQRRLGLLIQRTFEDHLYWVMVYARWADDTYFEITKETFFKKLPVPLRWIVPPIARKRAIKQVHAQGIGRHDRDTIYAMGLEDLKALSPYFKAGFLFGDQPSSYDAMAYGCLANILWMSHQTPLKDFVDEQPNLIAYCEFIQSKYWSKK